METVTTQQFADFVPYITVRVLARLSPQVALTGAPR